MVTISCYKLCVLKKDTFIAASLEELEEEVSRILAYLQSQKFKIVTICIGGIFTTFIAIVIFAKYL
jgi:hypothetical protein